MAQLIIEIPDAQVTRTINALSEHFGYLGPQQGTKLAFVKGEIAHMLKRIVLASEANTAARNALSQNPPDLAL